ncbi:tyrosine-type recombinase/integrase, partial [Streptomyces sp. NPDC088341]
MTAVVYAGEVLPTVPAGGALSTDAPDTLAGLLAGWLVWLRGRRLSRNTLIAYRADVAGWVAYCEVHGVDPVRASKRDVTGWQAVTVEVPSPHTGRPPLAATVTRRYAALRSWWDYLVDQDVIAGVPMPSGRGPRVEADSHTVFLSTSEARALEARLQVESLHDQVVILLLLHGGLRGAELGALDVGHVVVEQGATVAKVVGKGRRRRDVPLSAAAVAAVDAYLIARARAVGLDHPGDLPAGAVLCERPGGRRHDSSSLGRLVRRVAHGAGIESWRRLSAHSLRHTCATAMRDAGVPLDDVQAILGHASITTTQRYERGRGALRRKVAAVAMLEAA